MEQILQKSRILAANQKTTFRRSLHTKIDWQDRLIGILGARGTGKTTLLIQQLKQDIEQGIDSVYITLDDIYFSNNRLVDFAVTFIQQGGRVIYMDEVHKYPDWAREIKNIYDFHQNVKIIFTGSSITDMVRQNADLSRRAVQYELTGLSFREYLSFTNVLHAQAVGLQDLLTHHVDIAIGILTGAKPLQHFPEYLKSGYYPFFAENKNTYLIRLEQVVRMIVENDMRFIEGFDPGNARKIYQLLYILATNVPFKPNVAKLSEKIGIHRNTLVQYLHYLEKARLTNSMVASGKSISTLQKPDKLCLENANLHFALAPENTSKGTIREAFFLNQLRNAGHELSMPKQGDFYVDDSYTFEIGGKDKPAVQIKGVSNAYIAADEMETGVHQKIPLWLFGFLY